MAYERALQGLWQAVLNWSPEDRAKGNSANRRQEKKDVGEGEERWLKLGKGEAGNR